MPYTYLSLALVWLIIAALVAVTVSGLVAGPWRLLLVLAALATPFLLRSPAAGTVKRGRSRGLMSRLGRRPRDLGGSGHLSMGERRRRATARRQPAQ